eukprot:TRINITY_DN9823_c0_g1_i1.p1 TRINITY_DN9823_c0_g1~~TRINITY_DN9823_c0_g1_i1.p1  ORF type:complete len:324 (+),score=69.89 TRINITY_DN9823_c0_g1_i1:142-1113(+)
MALALLAAAAAAAAAAADAVECVSVPAPRLREVLPWYRTVRACWPARGGSAARYPLHVFAHGDFGGGASYEPDYAGLQEDLARGGFVVAGYLSCWVDAECANGELDVVQALLVVDLLAGGAAGRGIPVDIDVPWTASGHSTGARAVLMLAAAADTPAYLTGTAVAPYMTPALRAHLPRLAAVAADHPDPMYNARQNPDVPHYNVTRTPALIITGTRDGIEPRGSGWRDFTMLATPARAFVNIAHDTHLEPNAPHPHEARFIAAYARCQALRDAAACTDVYITLPEVLPVAGVGDANSSPCGGYVACDKARAVAAPPQCAQYCQ